MIIKEAIILAGGKGTRLRSLVHDVPKPMALIRGKPFLEILIETFYVKGIDHFILSVGYLSDVIIEHFTSKYPNIRISFSVEEEALGTGGAIRLALEKLEGEHSLVLNGDSLFDVDLDELEQFRPFNAPVIFGRQVNDVGRYGQFIFKGNRIEQYLEKQGHGSGYINGGVYVLAKNSLHEFPLHKKFSIETDFFSQFSPLKPAHFIISDDYFIDIGIPESYQRAQEELKNYIKNKALFLDRDGVINVDTGYLHTPEQCVFTEGIADLLKKAKEKDYMIIVVTNQAGIGRGYYTEDEFHKFMAWMNSQLAGLLDDYYFCPFHAEHGTGKYKQDSYDRKPNPGMFKKAIEKHNIAPEMSIMVGDRDTDMIAAHKANIQQKLLLGHDMKKTSQNFKIIQNLSEVAKYL